MSLLSYVISRDSEKEVTHAEPLVWEYNKDIERNIFHGTMCFITQEGFNNYNFRKKY